VSIWGHEYVRVEKDALKQEWRVYVSGPSGQLLCTVPWCDASRVFTDVEKAQYPDYTAAIATCASNPKTRLTEEEETGLAESRDEGTQDKNNSAETPDKKDNVLRINFVRGSRRR
jgi:hypothetical protein